jgi:hypothetical protein
MERIRRVKQRRSRGAKARRRKRASKRKIESGNRERDGAHNQNDWTPVKKWRGI